MPKLVDTTIRVLSQDPLAGTMPTASLLRLAEVLDGAGFAYLEVSGGGVFDAAVRRGVESPWERIRALKARTTTPLGLAVRGRWLVGPRPVGDDLVRRFVASAAGSGIDVFRLHDPVNDIDNLRVAAEAIVAAGKEFDGALLYGSNRPEALLEAASRLPELGAARVLLHDPAGLLQPHRASRLVEDLGRASGLPVGLYVQGAGGNALAAAIEAARAGAEVIATSLYPIALSLLRVSSEAVSAALSGLGLDPGVKSDVLWEAAHIVDEYIGDAPVAPPALRLAVRSAQRKVPVGIIAAVDQQLSARHAGDRLDDVLDELERVHRAAGSPPLAAPIGQIIASQALVNVLGANRYQPIVDELRDLVNGRFGRTPGPIDPALERAVELLPPPDEAAQVDLDELRERVKGLAASEEELLLVALFGEEAEPLLQSIRDRSSADELLLGASAQRDREEQIRAVVRIVQETGIGEITIEEEGMRVSVRQSTVPDAPAAAAAVAPAVSEPLDLPAPVPAAGMVRVESPMVGVFYRAPNPDSPPFVQEGDAVGPGQTLCILEAMKLMNEVKAELEGVVRTIHVQNGDPVEYGQLLFELEPLNGRPSGL